MRRFSGLYAAIDATTRTSVKTAALEAYFRDAPAADAAWALYFLAGGRLTRLVNTRQLREWAGELSATPPWLVDECYDAVGDLAETVALLLDGLEGDRRAWSLHRLVEERLQPLADADEATRRRLLETTWRELGGDQRLVWNKLITGAFRVGVGRGLVVRALARVAGLEPAQIAHRLAGEWTPSATAFRRLLDPEVEPDEPGRPYPFFLASALDQEPSELGPIGDWAAEWKWDGIRAQLIRRRGQTLIWSRGEELVTDRFPEVRDAAGALPDGTVLDGELLAWSDDVPRPFSDLQRRLGRTKVGRTLLERVPVVFMAYDLLERDGDDWRDQSLADRRRAMEQVVHAADTPRLLVSPLVEASRWRDLAALRGSARERGVEGVMLKRWGSPYRSGRPRGDWWKWKVDPLGVDAVMVYAQRGHGRRASLYTDYTFAVWDGNELVTVAKAYSGLTDAEILEVDRWVRRHIVERFGPVRRVEPELVFELAFEGIRRSSRHKAGLALRFPRIARWRRDKRPEEADTLGSLHGLMESLERSQKRHT